MGVTRWSALGTLNPDLVLSKDQRLTERVHTQLRLEVYNLFNRVQFTQSDNSLINIGTFGFSIITVARPIATVRIARFKSR
jgi:hypothetical protein